MQVKSLYQQKQLEVINALEDQVRSNSLSFSTVEPVDDYLADKRICLTSVHIPHGELISRISSTLINPLKQIAPDYFYYPRNSLHMTIKNIRVINNPPHFTRGDVRTAEKVFGSTIPKHKEFKVYFYRLFLFPNNFALIGTTDPELDNIIIDLDEKLKKAGIPDDKQYLNSKYFFSNMTLARFNSKPTVRFLEKVKELSNTLKFSPYKVDSVTLVTANAVFMNKNIIKTWNLSK